MSGRLSWLSQVAKKTLIRFRALLFGWSIAGPRSKFPINDMDMHVENKTLGNQPRSAGQPRAAGVIHAL
jgi:hypothetical protein